MAITNRDKAVNVARPFLRGFGQIMLQENAWTGLCFLIGIFYGSFIISIAFVLAVVTGTLTARLLKYDNSEINSGLYGFSAALVGAAMAFYFAPGIITWVAITIGSALATVIQHLFIVKKTPGYTFPFILVTWLLLFIFHHLQIPDAAQPIILDKPVNNAFQIIPLGFGQVIFQDNVWVGVIFFAGVFINRPLAAINAAAGAALSAFMAYKMGIPLGSIYAGVMSFNAVLCAITFTGNKPKHFLLILLSIALSVLIEVQMMKMNHPALTFPFVLASWITLLVQKGWGKIFQNN